MRLPSEVTNGPRNSPGARWRLAMSARTATTSLVNDDSVRPTSGAVEPLTLGCCPHEASTPLSGRPRIVPRPENPSAAPPWRKLSASSALDEEEGPRQRG